jgi:hypothetical protein
LIYSKSVKAHPLEIFIVIIIAGSMYGVLGMMLAIPGYTVIRVIAREFLDQYKFVHKLTQNMDAVKKPRKHNWNKKSHDEEIENEEILEVIVEEGKVVEDNNTEKLENNADL